MAASSIRIDRGLSGTAVIEIEINNVLPVDPAELQRLETAIRAVLAVENVDDATISLAIVDDATIRRLNRQYLAHDRPTDVLSFLLQPRESGLEGEVIVSAETAAACGPRLGWPAADELLLYAVHGVLHLLGYDDQSAADRARMRARERDHLGRLGLQPPDPDEPAPLTAPAAVVDDRRPEGETGT